MMILNDKDIITHYNKLRELNGDSTKVEEQLPADDLQELINADKTLLQVEHEATLKKVGEWLDKMTSVEEGQDDIDMQFIGVWDADKVFDAIESLKQGKLPE